MIPANSGVKWPKFLCKWRCLISIAAVALISISAFAQKAPKEKPVAPLTGAQIVSHGNEPELRVGGVPFFVHAAQFDYFRIPPDLWAPSLKRYQQLGINTIDLRIPWNWHEPSDGEFDFDGHTNPRRNLLGLLQLIAETHLKLIVRPGPLIGDQWRNAGYPPWLLAYSDYKMSAAAVEKGMAPPEVELAAHDGNAAARQWLANEIHMTYARRWLTAVAKELAPYAAKETITIIEPGDREGETQENEIAGPLLFVAIDDGVTIRTGSELSDVSRYLAELRGALIRGGLDTMFFMNASDAGRQGAASFSVKSLGDDQTHAGLAGQWFSNLPGGAAQSSLLTTADASSLAFLSSSLGMQPDFPPFLSGFASTTFAPAGDPRANQPPPENTLLASRLLLGSGIRAFVYSPLQDTLTPAGWETQSAARHFRWDAALDLAGNLGPRANGVARNGQFISSWGAMLAASHPRADFGIVDLRTCAPAADEATNSQNARTVEQLFHAAELAGFVPELVNPAAQSAERLLRDPVFLFPVPEEAASRPELQPKAQAALAEFVRRGGVQIDLPATGIEKLTEVLGHVGIVPGLRPVSSGQASANLIATELISNEIPALAGQPQSCVEGQLCAAALVNVTNLSPDQSATESFEMIDPRPAGTRALQPKISFDVNVPARESLLLPIHAPLCSAASEGERCADEVITAGAELLRAQREGKTLELTFYAPARAVVRLHLESAPSKVELDSNIRLDEQWKQETGELEVSLLRGAAPDYRRVLMVHLRYTPHVIEKPDPKKNGRRGSEYEVFDALRFPLAAGVTIQTYPPLILANPVSGGSMVISASNHADSLRAADFDLEGAFHGTGSARMLGIEQVFTRLRFQPERNSGTGEVSPTTAPDGLLHASLAIHSGREHLNVPVLFVPASETGNVHYQYDFDRDGAPEWVLESPRLRMIVSPADGGRGLALVDKSTNDDLITLGGGLHDFIAPADTPMAEALAASDFSFNRSYNAEWVPEKEDTNLRLTFHENGNSPAGIRVEKTLRLAAPETIETSYRVSFANSSISTPQGDTGAERSFVSMLSVPVPDTEEGNTQFCWEISESSAAQTPTGAPTPSQVPSNSHCEKFIPSGPPIPIPDGNTRLKIVSPGRPTFVVEWTSGQMIVAPKAFSADLNLVVPAPASTEAPAEFALRYTVESGQ